MNVSKVSRPSSILGGKSTYPSEASVHTNMYRSGYMLELQNSKDNRWFDLQYDRGDSGNKIMAD